MNIDAAGTPRHRYEFVESGWMYQPVEQRHVVHSLFDPDALARFERDGFISASACFEDEDLRSMLSGLDGLRDRLHPDDLQSTAPEESEFQGQYLPAPCFSVKALRRLLQPDPVVDTVRSILGPHVWLRNHSARVTLPGMERDATGWHLDHLVTVEPAPVMARSSDILGCILYFDRLDEDNGPLEVVPGSHQWRRRPDWELDPGVEREAVCLPAGSLLFFHGALWHRAAPAKASSDRPRRCVIMHFQAEEVGRFTKQKAPPPPGSVEAELLAEAREAGDQGLLEVLGSA